VRRETRTEHTARLVPRQARSSTGTVSASSWERTRRTQGNGGAKRRILTDRRDVTPAAMLRAAKTHCKWLLATTFGALVLGAQARPAPAQAPVPGRGYSFRDCEVASAHSRTIVSGGSQVSGDQLRTGLRSWRTEAACALHP